jgi:hypothetical protein
MIRLRTEGGTTSISGEIERKPWASLSLLYQPVYCPPDEPRYANAVPARQPLKRFVLGFAECRGYTDRSALRHRLPERCRSMMHDAAPRCKRIICRFVAALFHFRRRIPIPVIAPPRCVRPCDTCRCARRYSIWPTAGSSSARLSVSVSCGDPGAQAVLRADCGGGLPLGLEEITGVLGRGAR